MTFWELILIAVGLAMDAFAVSVCKGLSAGGGRLAAGLICGAYFGAFQALMPVLGWLLGVRFQAAIVKVDHWIAFCLLSLIGFNMLRESRKSETVSDSFRPAAMLPLAVATSIDALAVGVTFGVFQVRIVPAAALIGGITFVLSVLGTWIGVRFGARFRNGAEAAGGALLLLMALKIVLEHLGRIP